MNTMYSVLIINEGGNSRLAAVLVGFFVLGTRNQTTSQRYRMAKQPHVHIVALAVSRAMAFGVASSC